MVCIYMTRKLVLLQKRLKNSHLISDHRKTKKVIEEIQQKIPWLWGRPHCFPLSLKLYNIDVQKVQKCHTLYFPDCSVWAEGNTIWTGQFSRSGSLQKLVQILELQLVVCFFFFPREGEEWKWKKMSVKKTMQGPNLRAEEVCNGECSWDSCAEAYLS